MKQSKVLDNILDECLERLLGGETIEQCLESYPEYVAELQPLLQTALAVKRAASVQPGPGFRARARAQFNLELREMETRKGYRLFGWQSWWAAAVAAVLVLLLLGGGTVAAAGYSMPGQPLYQVKLATEQVRLELATSDLVKAELYAKLADKRVAEIIYAAGKDNPRQVQLVTQRLDDHLAQITVLAGGVEEDVVMLAPEGAPEAMVMAPAPAPQLAPEAATEAPPVVTEAPDAVPSPAVEEVPKSVKPAPESAREATMVEEETPEPLPSAVPSENAAEAVRRNKLKVKVENNAVSNNNRLYAALEVVPDSVKPALRRAIIESEMGYQRALRSLEGGAGNKDTSGRADD